MTTRPLSLLIALALVFASACSTPSDNPSEEYASLTETTAEESKAEHEPVYKDSEVIPIGDSPTLGPDNAPVTIVMFSDLQCPFCQRGDETMRALLAQYPSEVKVVLKHFPLPFHPQAKTAAMAAIAAGNQGKFWPMHDWLFAHQKELRKHDQDMKSWTADYARELGLDVAQFERDFDAPETRAQLERDLELGKKLAVRGTPHFFVNGERVVGAKPQAAFEEVVAAKLKQRKELLAAGAAPEDTYQLAVTKNYDNAAPKAAPVPKPTAKIAYVPVEPNDPVFGNTKDPLVTIVEFSDFQCPFCARVAPTVGQIKDEYGDQVRFVFKQLPLDFHRQAKPAARAALAAHQQGKFWEMHDLLFENQKDLKKHQDDFEAFATELAKKLDLDLKKFTHDYHSEAIAEQIERDLKLAKQVGSRGTPNFWINGVNIRGAQPFAKFKSTIDAQIQEAQKLKDEKKLSGDALYKAAVELNKSEAPARPARPAPPTPPKDTVDLKDLALDDAPVKGPKDAPVTVLVFSDFECPFCQRGDANLKKALAAYDGKVKVAFKHFPLPFHKNARTAAHAALAAGEQGKFWEMHDLIFENQRNLGDESLYPKLAKQLGLNVNTFKKDMKNPDYGAAIDQDLAQGKKVGVRGTPAFFINGTRIVGAQPSAKFEEAIETALEEAK